MTNRPTSCLDPFEADAISVADARQTIYEQITPIQGSVKVALRDALNQYLAERDAGGLARMEGAGMGWVELALECQMVKIQLDAPIASSRHKMRCLPSSGNMPY